MRVTFGRWMVLFFGMVAVSSAYAAEPDTRAVKDYLIGLSLLDAYETHPENFGSAADETASFDFFLPSAYAAGDSGKACVVAGYLGKMVGGSCKYPAAAPDALVGRIDCNPALFGAIDKLEAPMIPEDGRRTRACADKLLQSVFGKEKDKHLGDGFTPAELVQLKSVLEAKHIDLVAMTRLTDELMKVVKDKGTHEDLQKMQLLIRSARDQICYFCSENKDGHVVPTAAQRMLAQIRNKAEEFAYDQEKDAPYHWKKGKETYAEYRSRFERELGQQVAPWLAGVFKQNPDKGEMSHRLSHWTFGLYSDERQKRMNTDAKPFGRCSATLHFESRCHGSEAQSNPPCFTIDVNDPREDGPRAGIPISPPANCLGSYLYSCAMNGAGTPALTSRIASILSSCADANN